MKKSLIALAVFGAFTGVASAADSVQLYGIIDLGVAHYSNGNGSVTKLGTGIQSGSRIGLKGSEDLGGGLSAFFQAETGFCANGGSKTQATGAAGGPGADQYCTGGGFMGRTSMIGLKGGFGTVAAGRMYTLTFNDQAAVDPFGYGLTGTISNIGTIGAPARASQMVAYISPSFGGFNVAGGYVFGDALSAQPANTTGAYNLHAGYNNGPIMVGLDYLRVNSSTGNPVAKHTMLVGTYDLGVAKLAGMYAQNQLGSATGVTGDKLQSFMLGVTVPVGPGAILASYTQSKDKNVANSTSKQIAVGYTYALSKRTNLYTSYAHIANGSATFAAVGDATGNNDAPAGGLGMSSSGFALGIRHQF